jgi:uncharacterized membrane protein YhaH (DUF805 family)
MTFPEAIKTCLQKYAVFEGRASQSEFWWFALLYFAVLFPPAIVAAALEPDSYTYGSENDVTASDAFGIVVAALVLALILPYLAAGVRRLHDTGQSGWWWFISLIPLLGGLVLLVMLASSGSRDWNTYGPPPGAEPSSTPPPSALPPPPPPPPP